MTDTTALRATFLHDLAHSGSLTDPRWLAAFRDIPREVFVPYFFTPADGRPGWRLVERPSPEWFYAVFSQDALVTQVGGRDDHLAQARAGDAVRGAPTSSSSAPTLMGLMLEALDVEDGHRVLEVGTGTGYNTALLCHRLGPEQVTSIDVDAGLVAQARERLAALGYHPHLHAADGTQGCPARAPFDRIIATVGLDRLPQAWIDQTTPGGTILLPLGIGGLLALLTRHADGTAQGRFLPDTGYFMALRAQQYTAEALLRAINEDDGHTRPTDLPATLAADVRDPFEFFAALRTGGYATLGFLPSDGSPEQTWLTAPDGSWARHTTHPDNGTHTVRQGGPTHLWDTLEHAHHEWQALGEPHRQQFGLTVHNGQHTLWLEHPGSRHRWPLADQGLNY